MGKLRAILVIVFLVGVVCPCSVQAQGITINPANTSAVFVWIGANGSGGVLPQGNIRTTANTQNFTVTAPASGQLEIKITVNVALTGVGLGVHNHLSQWEVNEISTGTVYRGGQGSGLFATPGGSAGFINNSSALVFTKVYTVTPNQRITFRQQFSYEPRHLLPGPGQQLGTYTIQARLLNSNLGLPVTGTGTIDIGPFQGGSQQQAQNQGGSQQSQSQVQGGQQQQRTPQQQWG